MIIYSGDVNYDFYAEVVPSGFQSVMVVDIMARKDCDGDNCIILPPWPVLQRRAEAGREERAAVRSFSLHAAAPGGAAEASCQPGSEKLN